MASVLVLDGFDESRERTAGALRVGGYSVVAVAEEEEALDALQTHEIDIVLLDIPIDEAIDAVQAMRARASTVCIIALIEATDTTRRDAARTAGIDFFVLRPCPPAQLLKHLKRFAR